LSDEWLFDEIRGAGWKGSDGLLRIVDERDDHRLVDVTHNGLQGRLRARILHGFDLGIQFWIRVYRTLETVPAAIAWLKPTAVARAEARGVEVPRQGDWFFIPCPEFQHGAIRTDAAYGRHRIEFWSAGRAKGRVTHIEHDAIWLDGWHLPCRCRGWHSFEGAPRVHNQAYWLRTLTARGAHAQ